MDLSFSWPLVLEIAVLLVSVTWIIGQIKSTTRELMQAVKALKEAIVELKATVLKIDDRVTDHAERIVRLEAQLRLEGRAN